MPSPSPRIPRVQNNCPTCPWRPGTELSVLDREEATSLDRKRTRVVVMPGQYVFQQGEACLGLHAVAAGVVAIRRSDGHGNSALVRLVHAGQTLGYRDFFARSAYTADAQALTRTEVCFLDGEQIRCLLDCKPQFSLRFLERMSEDLEQAETSILQQTASPVRARFATLVLALRERYGKADSRGRLTIDLPMSRRDIAQALGARVETVVRTIRALEADGVLRSDGRRLFVPDLDKLLDEVEQVEPAV